MTRRTLDCATSVWSECETSSFSRSGILLSSVSRPYTLSEHSLPPGLSASTCSPFRSDSYESDLLPFWLPVTLSTHNNMLPIPVLLISNFGLGLTYCRTSPVPLKPSHLAVCRKMPVAGLGSGWRRRAVGERKAEGRGGGELWVGGRMEWGGM